MKWIALVVAVFASCAVDRLENRIGADEVRIAGLERQLRTITASPR